jgi:hypothetical protein
MVLLGKVAKVCGRNTNRRIAYEEIDEVFFFYIIQPLSEI